MFRFILIMSRRRHYSAAAARQSVISDHEVDDASCAGVNAADVVRVLSWHAGGLP